MNTIRDPIKKVEVITIQDKKNNKFVVNAKVDGEIIEFEFQMIYEPQFNGFSIERSRNFIEIAKYNSEFESAIHSLVKKVFHGEELIFPIKFKFE